MSDLAKLLRDGTVNTHEHERNGGRYDVVDEHATDMLMDQAADDLERLEEELRDARGEVMASDMLLEEKRELIAMMNNGDVPLDGDLWLAMRDERDEAKKEAERLRAIVERLPKNGAGEPLIFGDTVFWFEDVVQTGTWRGITEDGPTVRLPWGETCWPHNEQLFATSDEAEAANQ